MNEILSKIKEYRKKKGYTYQAMAYELNISPAAYRKIELNQTRLTLERLFEIAQILDAKIVDILGIDLGNHLSQANNENSAEYQQQIENYFQENKEKSEKIVQLYEERLKDKEAIILQMQKTIDTFIK